MALRITFAFLMVVALALVTPPVAASPQFGEWSAPVNLGPVVNSSAIEFGPAITPNGLSLYISVFSESKGDEDIFVSHRQKRTDPWGPPVSLTTINTSANERVPAFSRDGLIMFFASDRPGGFGSTDVWMSRRDNPRDDFGWGPPVNLGPGVNTAAGEAGPTLFERAGGDDEDANDSGAVLIFNRDPGTGQDLYMSVRGRDGSFGVATAITELNTPFTDARATIRSDGLEIFFFSNRTGSRQADLWTATRSRAGDPWSAPVNVGPDGRGSLVEVGRPIITIWRAVRSSGIPRIRLASASCVGPPNQAVPPPYPSIVAPVSRRSVRRPSSYAPNIGSAPSRTIAIPTGAVASQPIGGRNAAIFFRRSLSRTTMKRHGWLFFALPVQRASSKS